MPEQQTIGMYWKDPVLRICVESSPEAAEPMDAEERQYFACVADAYFDLRMRPTPEFAQAWQALRAEFLDDALFPCEKPPTPRRTAAQIEALALLLRVTCVRHRTAIWRGYYVELAMALRIWFHGKARARGLQAFEDGAQELLGALFLGKTGKPPVLPMEQPEQARQLAQKAMPLFWRFDPRYYFQKWMDRVANNYFTDLGRKEQRERNRTLSFSEAWMAFIPDKASTEGDALRHIGRQEEDERGRRLMEQAKRLNSIGLNPEFVQLNIQRLLEGATAGDAKAELQLAYLQALAEEPENRTRARERAERDAGGKVKLGMYQQEKLYYQCVDAFLLFCVEHCEADPALLAHYLRRIRPSDKDCPREAEVKRRMQRQLERLEV